MRQINELFEKAGMDGCKHVILSAVIACLIGLVLPTWIAALITFGIGIGKEVYDKVSGRGCAEWKDLVCDVVGIIIGVL